MRIGILSHDSFGGSARIATELASGLARNGHYVHLFAYSPPFGERVDQPKVKLHTLRSVRQKSLHPSSLFADWSSGEIKALAANIIQVIVDEGLDILHFHYAVPFSAVFAEIRRYLGSSCPITVGTFHGTDVTVHGRSPGAKREQLVEAISELDALTTVSFSHAELSRETFGLSALPTVIPNFVDLERYRPETDRSASPKIHRPNPGRLKVVHLSNFRPVKRIPDVVRIFCGLRQRIDAELWLVGDGEAMAHARESFDTNKIIDHVRFWGLQQDVSPILGQTDLMIVASEYESFCLAALESMACGVPVLATDVGGLPELISNTESGLLFPLGDCEAAVELASELLSDPDRRQAMGEAARTLAQTYGSEQIVPLYERLYHQLVEQR